MGHIFLYFKCVAPGKVKKPSVLMNAKSTRYLQELRDKIDLLRFVIVIAIAIAKLANLS